MVFTNFIISTNGKPSPEEFESLLEDTVNYIYEKYSLDQSRFEGIDPELFEVEVEEAMQKSAIRTPFENSIKRIGGHAFPDIVARKYYGVEVKTGQGKNWQTTGNSVLEGSRIHGVERIYLFFGKTKAPCEFRYRKYEECIYDVKVTHSPRYAIDMDLEPGKTLFDEMDIAYDVLRKSKDPLGPILDYMRRKEPGADKKWWVGESGEEIAAPFTMRFWSELKENEKKEIRTICLANFPEIFGPSSRTKYEKVAAFLVKKHAIVCSSLRDMFTAGGQFTLILHEKRFSKVPRVFKWLTDDEILSNLFDLLEGKAFPNWLREFQQEAENHLNGQRETALNADDLVLYLRKRYSEKLKG